MSKRNADLITEELFREAYRYEEVKKPPPKKVIAEFLRCSKETIFNFIPALRWLPKYNVKNNIVGDLVAGVTVAVMHIPHGLAYAPLGRVDPVVGFYMALFPVIVYMFLGTSRHISIGTFAVLCAMVGQVVMKHEPVTEIHWGGNATNMTNMTNTTQTNSSMFVSIEVGVAVCLMVGVWEAALGLLKLGSLTVVMSESLVSGFTTGAAIHVLSYQLKNLFGVEIPPHSGVFKLICIYKSFFSNITTVNIVTMSVSFCCIFILLLFNEYLKILLKKRFPKNKIPVPIELIVIVLGILLSYFLELKSKYNVSVVGNIPRGLPKPSVPQSNILKDVIIDSFVIALVALAINLSLAKIFAKKSFYTVSSNQEFFAYGMANIVGSFFSCLPSAASLSRSTIQYTVGGKTQLASLFSIIFIVFILLFAGPLFEPVPYCVLSSIVVVTLKGLVFQMCDLCQIWRESWVDGVVWLGTFLAVIILDLDYGLGVGIALSLISLVYNSYKIEASILGQVPNTNMYLDIDRYRATKQVPNVLIMQVQANLNFSNSSRFEKIITKQFTKFSKETADDSTQISFILDMSAVTQIDPTAVNSLRHLYSYLDKFKCDLYLTNCNINVYRMFEVCNLFKDIPKDRILASVADAVEYLSSSR